MLNLVAALCALLSPLDHNDAPVWISGRVVRVAGGDSISTPHAKVILHRISSSIKGPVDSSTTSADGSFRFRVTPQPGDIFLVSATWSGLEYFAPPLPAEALKEDRIVRVIAADTSSSTAVLVAVRQIVLVEPGPTGARDAVDVITLANRTGLTRIPSGSGQSSWWMLLPSDAVEPRVDTSDFADDAFQISGDTLYLHTPIPPGEHLIYLSWQIPPGTRQFRVPTSDAVDSMVVMSGESGMGVGEGFHAADSRELDGKSFSQWLGKGSAAGSITISLPGDGTVPGWLLPLLVGLLAVGLCGAAYFALRRGQRTGHVVN